VRASGKRTVIFLDRHCTRKRGSSGFAVSMFLTTALVMCSAVSDSQFFILMRVYLAYECGAVSSYVMGTLHVLGQSDCIILETDK